MGNAIMIAAVVTVLAEVAPPSARPVIDLAVGDLALAAVLIGVNVAVSIVFRLRLERSLAIAAVRTVVQLVAVGFILQQLFEFVYRERTWPLVLAVMLLMGIVAGQAAVARVSHRFRGIHVIASGAMLGANFTITLIGCLLIVRMWDTVGRPGASGLWYDPQYLIPIGGMMLGNSVSGIALGLDRLLTGLTAHRARIELMLSHGATPAEAARDVVREAARTGLTPIINMMSVVGLVSLPGMMTGQILSGADPMTAVKYQILILFLIAAATALGTMTVIVLGARAMFDSDARLRLDRLQPRK